MQSEIMPLKIAGVGLRKWKTWRKGHINSNKVYLDGMDALYPFKSGHCFPIRGFLCNLFSFAW